MKSTITNNQGDNEYVSLPAAQYESKRHGREDYGTGVWLTGIWRGPRTGRMFVRTYSIWDDGRGRNVGERIREVEEHEYLRACRVAGIDPKLTPVEV